MVLVIAALAGALLALAAVWIAGAVGRRFPLKESRPVPQAPERSRDDLIDLVGALPLGGLLVGPHDEVMKVNDLGVAMGLVRGTRVGSRGCWTGCDRCAERIPSTWEPSSRTVHREWRTSGCAHG